MRASHCIQRFEQRLTRYADVVEQCFAFRSLDLCEREQQVLCRDVLVAEILGLFFSPIENLCELSRKIRLRVALFRVACSFCLGALAQCRDAYSEFLENRHDDPFVLIEEGEQQMQIVDDRVPRAARSRNSFVERFPGFDGKTIGIDHGLCGCKVGAPLICHTGKDPVTGARWPISDDRGPKKNALSIENAFGVTWTPTFFSPTVFHRLRDGT